MGRSFRDSKAFAKRSGKGWASRSSGSVLAVLPSGAALGKSG